MIRSKEAELHAIQQLRCDHLEKLVREREALLLEASKRFDQLRDDFQYNLTLLEARDSELRRLEDIITNNATRIATLENEKKTLLERCDGLIRKDEERTQQIEEEKAAHKTKIVQLKQEIETLTWMTAEENRAKSREIESLKADITRMTASHHEALDRQRSEMQHTFDRINEDRANEYDAHERDIAQQISALDERFELLKTENLRLKATSNDAQRQLERLTEEVAAKDALLNRLMWQVEDDRKSKVQTEDLNIRQISKLTIEINALKETSAREVEEFKRSLEKSYQETARESELRKTAESKLEERKRQYQEQLLSLQDELQYNQQRIDELEIDASALRSERDTALDRLAAARTEMESVELRAHGLNKQSSALHEDLAIARGRIRELEHELREAVAQAAEAIAVSERSARTEVLAAESIKGNAVAANQRVNDAELESLKAVMQEHADQLMADLRRDYDKQLAELESMVRRVNIDNDHLRGVLSEREAQLREQEQESAALGLRLNIYESRQQHPHSQQQPPHKQSHTQGGNANNVLRHSHQSSEGGFGMSFGSQQFGMYASQLI
jgi:chromosome segregation ATPase